jgi:hypothetical protein
MRMISAAILSTLLIAVSANAQEVQPAAKPAPVCLRPNEIDHTQTVDASNILFYMRGGKIWRNTLQGPCPGLRFNGFAYEVHGDEICSNMQSIHVIHDEELCFLGAFTPYVPPPKPPSP